VCLVAACVAAVAHAENGMPAITVQKSDGASVPLEVEDTSSLANRPLVKTQERLREKFKRDFFFLRKINVPEGTSLIGRYPVTDGPMRLTIYEITKKKGAERQLKVVASGFYKSGEVAEFKTEARKFEEHVYLVTAEATGSAEELNSHLRYMNTQGNEILLKGYSTNFSLSLLRFKLAERPKGTGGETEFAKDADWLVDNLIRPQWVVSIRSE
jgi:hypothetical protein